MTLKSIITQTALASLLISFPVISLLNVDSAPTQARQISTKNLRTKLFSLRYPANWLTISRSDEYVIFSNQPLGREGGAAPKSMVKTDVGVIEGNFTTLVSEHQKQGIVKSKKITINGREAIRFWDRNNLEDFQRGIFTYVRYTKNKVGFVATYYSDTPPISEAEIEQIQSSFRILK
ncbi:hypothetical protein [Anabaena sp. CCY 9402-a]|uniref:hypothetical protein n=1 Tax=Anabaena sp. CCY 9402-a TaxID=3103867 RepID=UPI0039C6902F